MNLDPETITCGPATDSVKAIARTVQSIRWFEPSAADPARARTCMEEHMRRVREEDARALPASVEITHERGGWTELRQLTSIVREPPRPAGYDWKFGVLKPLGHAHSTRLGWSLLAHARTYQGPTPSPADLALVLDDAAIWLLPFAVAPRLPSSVTPEAHWYIGYALQDAFEAIEWQLAKGNDDTSDNPFVPLLELYAAGVLPFSLSADRMLLLHFTPS